MFPEIEQITRRLKLWISSFQPLQRCPEHRSAAYLQRESRPGLWVGRDLLFFRWGRLIINGHSSQRLDVTARAFPLPLSASVVAAATAEKRVLGVGGNHALMASFR